MGQRHQIYVRLPKKFYNAGNPNNEHERTIAIHHQWLYGRNACESLARLLTFVQNSDTYGPFGASRTEESTDALAAIYSVDPESGYYHSVYKFKQKSEHPDDADESDDQDTLDNPMRGDNNNGITVVDLTGERPTYCFVSLTHLECLDKTMEDKVVNLKPMSAETYLKLHYPKPFQKECDCADCSKREPNWTQKHLHNHSAASHAKSNFNVLATLSQYQVMTEERLKKIFPKMFKGEK